MPCPHNSKPVVCVSLGAETLQQLTLLTIPLGHETCEPCIDETERQAEVLSEVIEEATT
jgi:hypothetical protein